MPSCAFRKCTNYTSRFKKLENISFHLVPKDELMKEKWVNVIRTQRREDDWMPTAFTTVCSEHFLASDFTVMKKYVCLKKTAVPVIKQEEFILSSPTSLEQVNMSDKDPIVDNLRKELLKTMKLKIRKILQAKQKLQLQNYNLVRKNKRLKQKCSNLQQIVSKLRMNEYLNIEPLNQINLKTEAGL